MSENLKSLALKLKDAFEKEGASNFDATLFIQSIDNESIRQKLLKKMVDEGSYEYEIVDRVAVDAVKRIKQKWYKERYRILGIEIKRAEERGNHELCEKLLAEKERLRKEEAIL
jgi:hypothetical protein